MSEPLMLCADENRGLEMGKRYEWFRSAEWNNLSGVGTNCWVVYVEPKGWNGSGGYWIDEIWTWRNDGCTHHIQPRSLSREKSIQLEAAIAKAEGRDA